MGLGALTLWTKLSRVNHQTLLWYYCLSCAPSCSCLVCPENFLDDQQMSSVECETLNPAPYTKSAIGKQRTTTRREDDGDFDNEETDSEEEGFSEADGIKK